MKEKNNIPKLRFPEFSEKWNTKRIDEVSEVNRGKSKHRPRNAKKLYGGKYPFVQTGDIRESNLYLDSYSQTYSEEGLKQSKLWNEGTLCITIAANIAETAILKIKACFPDSIIGLIPKENSTTVLFIKHQFDKFKIDIQRLSQGVAQDNLNLEKLSKIEFNFPTLPEQQKIASFLTAVDSKIELLQKKKQGLEQYKKGVMQQIFSQKLRFKDDKGNNYPDWEEKKISEIFKVTRGQVLASTKVKTVIDNDYKYPVYSSQTLNDGLMGYYNEHLFENAITWTTDGANAGVTKFRKDKFYCTNVCGVLLSNEGYANQMIAELLNTVTKRHVSYVGNPKLMNNVMSGIKITIPKSVEEQAQIANFLSAIDDKIALVNTQLENTQQFKKGLLQQMFV